MRHRVRYAYAALLVAIVLSLLAAPNAFAHGGHGKPELQFKVVPKEIVSPGKVMIRMGGVEITRAEFFDYIRNVAAFQMKADLLQRDYLLHYWVVEGLSRYYPEDINDLMSRLVSMDPNGKDYKKRISAWALRQADLYPRLRYYAKKAAGSKTAHTGAVLETFEKHIKANFLEDLVSLGDMKPTFMGVRRFVVDLPKKRYLADDLFRDPQSLATYEWKDARMRWITYRRDLVANADIDLLYKEIESVDIPVETPIAKVNGRDILLRDFLAVYGPVPTDVNWNQIKRSRGAQMVRAYAMADEVDMLRVFEPRYHDKIVSGQQFYLAADEIVAQYGAKLLGVEDPEIDFQFYRQIVYYPNLIKFEKLFLEESAKLPVYEKLWIDKDYLSGVEWVVEPAYTPKQASYF